MLVVGMTDGEPDGGSRRWWEVGLMVKGVSKDSSHPCSRCTTGSKHAHWVYTMCQRPCSNRGIQMKTHARVMASSSSQLDLLARLVQLPLAV